MKTLSILILLITLLPTANLAAQTPVPQCGQLSEEDCTIYTQAAKNMAQIGSFNNANYTLHLGGSGGTSTGNDLLVTGSGPMLVDENGMIDALHFAVEGGFNGETSPGEIIIQDEMLYLGRPDADGEMQWSGLITSGEDAIENGQLIADVVTGNLFFEAFAQPGVLSPQRGDDTEMNGQTMLVFESDINPVVFLLTPSLLATVETLMGDLGAAQDTGEAGQNPFAGGEADIAGAIQLLPLLMEQDTFRYVQWVGEEDGLVHHFEIVVDIILNAAMIDPSLNQAGFNFELTSDLDQHGTDFTIEAPGEYEVVEDLGFDLSAIPLGDLVGGGDEGLSDDERYAVEDTISYGDTVTGTLSSGNQQDVWGFEAQAGDVVTIILKAAKEESSLDTQIYLRDPQGMELAFNDDHDGSREGLAIFDSLITQFEIPADGEYRIVATWLTQTRDGDYELTLEKEN